MSDFKEFLGKTLDAAIAEACAYYDAPREKLEIEIIEDAKSGIFGIVGARKARIQARRAQLPELGRSSRDRKEKNAPAAASPAAASVDAPGSAGNEAAPAGNVPAEEKPLRQEKDPSQNPQEKPQEKSQEERQKKRGRRGAGKSEREEGEEAGHDTPAYGPAYGEDDARDGEAAPEAAETDAPRGRRSRRGRNGESDKPHEQTEGDNGVEQDTTDLPPRVALTDLDQEKLVRVSTDIIRALVESIADDAAIEVSVSTDRLQVRVDCADTGLLIGRDGQNLAAVQYLATRMIARVMDAQIRLQLDAGDYHSRQDSRLQELALSLAEKVKLTGRSQSTRPLSAYQRRLIHLCLQDDPDVQTRSSGDGAMKRVVIMRRKDRDLLED